MKDINPEITIEYLDFDKIIEDQYVSFLSKFYADRVGIKFPIRYNWLNNAPGFVIILAFYKGEIVGQTSGVKNYAFVKGVKEEWWWSVDTFVLPQMRGKRIGYMLQQKLHNELKNFSSASYTKLNGKSKKSSGANDLFYNSFIFFPINSYLRILIKTVVKKYFNKDLQLRLPRINFYYFLNRKKVIDVSIQENDFFEQSTKILSFIQSTLKKKDFYMERTEDFIHWKYYENPSVKVNNLTFYRNDKIIAEVFFSDVYNTRLINIQAKICKVLDVFMADEKDRELNKIIISEIGRYFIKRKIKIDGLCSMQKFNYYPYFTFLHQPLLSTHKAVEFSNPYLSYGDADMEQMV